MKTYEELIEKAEQVRTNELPESNTHDLIGEIFTGIVESQKQTSKENDNTFKEKVDKNNITGDFGSSVDKVIHQKAFTEQTQGRVLGKVDIKDLDSLNSTSDLGFYHVFKDNLPVGEMIVTGDNMQRTIIQVVVGNYMVDDGTLNAHTDNKATIVYRIYNLNATNLNDISRKTWGKWHYLQESFLKSEHGASVTDTVTQKFFTEQTKDRVIGIVDFADIDMLNNLKSLGHYHVYSGKKPMHELIVTSDSMYHTIIQFMFSNYTVEDGELNEHRDNIATIVYRIYNLSRDGMAEIPRGTWSKWRQYGQNFEVLSETEYENLKSKNSEMFYYTYEEEEEV